MMEVSIKGMAAATQALTDLADTLHLRTRAGELTAVGYRSVQILKNGWVNGVYPTQKWIIQSDIVQTITAYQVRLVSGGVYYTEVLPEPIQIGEKPREVGVSMQILLFQRTMEG